MAAVVFATPGKLYLTPTTVTGATGTLIEGIQDREITTEFEGEMREYLTGIGSSAGLDVVHGRKQSARLIIPLRRQDSTGLKILYSHLTTDGSTHRPTGGTAADEFTSLPSFALILRPDKTTEKYLYSPNWRVTRNSLFLLQHSEVLPQLSNAVLELVATRPSNASGPPYAWATSANIASIFSLTENP